MLNQDDRNAIDGLFNRLREVERRAPPRDTEAEALIGEKIARQPGAPYYLAQTVLVQEHALEVADRRIRELEAELERQPQDDFLGGLFGPGRGRALSRQQTAYREQRGPWDRRDRYADNRGGGFLAGAAQTALGVTGGMLLGSFIGSMFGAGAANAAEANMGQDNAGGDQGGGDAGPDNDFGGGDFGDGGGFDMGGDF